MDLLYKMYIKLLNFLLHMQALFYNIKQIQWEKGQMYIIFWGFTFLIASIKIYRHGVSKSEVHLILHRDIGLLSARVSWLPMLLCVFDKRNTLSTSMFREFLRTCSVTIFFILRGFTTVLLYMSNGRRNILRTPSGFSMLTFISMW